MQVEYRVGLDRKPGRVELEQSDGSIVMREVGTQAELWSAPRDAITVEVEQASGAWQESRSFKRGILRAGKKHGPLSAITLRTDDATIVALADATPAEVRAHLGL